MRRVHALQFDLETPPHRSTSIIVWPDMPTELARPADPHQEWLDVQAGDAVYLSGKIRRVSAVRLFRGEPDIGHRPVVVSGRAWMSRELYTL